MLYSAPMKEDQNQEDFHNDDMDVEVEATDEDGNASQTKLQKLKEQLKTVQKEKEEYLQGWQRAQADLVNLRKRDGEKLAQAVEHAEESLLEDILPVIDSFDSAMKNQTAWQAVDANWRLGVEYIYNQLQKVLEEHSVTEIPTTGEYQAEFHEVVEEKDSENTASGHIIDTVQKGYRLKNKVLRIAKVVVAK